MPQTFWISTGTSRKETSWKNVELTWDEIAKRLEKTVVTPETLKEYLAFDKSLQDERKDVGGFVGGTIAGGRRKKGSVTSRSLLTLDVDFAKMDFWEDFQALFSHAAFVYGTHKHYDQHPRFRLVMPLLREVHADEYEAIGRWVASMIDIEVFDPTTFQAERLMYWPSTPKDQTYYFRRQVGKILDPDKVLAQYRDWKDQSQWAYSAKVEKAAREGTKKLGEPTEKPGLIGAFCRSYGITEAIEKYLPDAYGETEADDRFTYLAGSTFGGLVVYDDKFAYSHHGTDPISGRCVNSWDLVRIHLFGKLDEGAADRTNVSKLPSQAAMTNLVNGDPVVIGELMEERKARAMDQLFGPDSGNDENQARPNGQRNEGAETGTGAGAGAGAVEAVELEDESWLGMLEVDKKGALYTSYRNIELILENDKRIRGRIRFNELTRQTEVVKRLPWDRKGTVLPREWTDDDWNLLRKLLGSAPYELLRSPKLEDCMSAVRLNNRYHPIKEYLESVRWDGTDRLDYVLIDYLGAEDSDYTRAVTRKALIAAVARVYRPGIKFDYVLTLVGPQRIGKSTLISRLGNPWFSDTFSFLMLHSGNKAYEQIRGRWIVEIGEMAGLRKADVEAAKSFISSQKDSYRPAYGREIMEQPRQMIFIGSTNKPEFLKKFSGGNARFWPVDVMVQKPELNIFKALSQGVVDQIWAEAVELFKGGETIYLTPEMEAEAFAVQADHEESVDLAGVVYEYLETLLPDSWEDKTAAERASYFKYKDGLSAEGTVKRDKVSAPEIWCECMGKNKGDMTTQNTKIIHEIMGEMEGWETCRWKIRFKEYGRLKGYVRKGSNVAAVATKEI